MKQTTLYQLSAYSLIGGAVCMAGFWLLAVLLGSFAGASVTHTLLWLPGQALHILAALLTIFGVFGLYAVHREQMGALDNRRGVRTMKDNRLIVEIAQQSLSDLGGGKHTCMPHTEA